MDYEYNAKLPSEDGKSGKKLGNSGNTPGKRNFHKLKESIQEVQKSKEMIERVTKRVRLSSDGWTALKADLDAKMSKDYLCKKFGFKPNDLKWLKRALGY